MVIPEKLFIADLDIKEEMIFERMNEWKVSQGMKPLKRPRNKESLLVNELKQRNMFCNDWLLRENKIYTFKNLSNDKEFFSQLVDKGTIVELKCQEY